VIAYFDTSAIIPLIVDEPASVDSERVWNEADRVVGVRLLYAEARAALARAERMGRVDGRQLGRAIDELDALVDAVDFVEVTDQLVRVAGQLAEDHALRGYDAVHLAAALSVADDDLVLVTGDRELAAAALDLGLGVAETG
jgi:predicted nucleic acid-binding protein